MCSQLWSKVRAGDAELAVRPKNTGRIAKLVDSRAG
jgi:hypothetical protein